MKKALALAALVSTVLTLSVQARGDFSAEDRSELARLEAKLKASEQQYGRLQQEIAKIREDISRHESASHVRAASSVKRSYSERGEVE